MKLWLIILAILGCCHSTVGLATPTERASTEKLLFEDIGPSDASIPSFSIELGEVDKSTRTIFFVSPEAYEDVFSLVRHGGKAPSHTPRPVGTFKVTSYKNEKPDEIYTIYPETVLSIISRLSQMYQNTTRQLPELLVKLETQLTSPK